MFTMEAERPGRAQFTPRKPMGRGAVARTPRGGSAVGGFSDSSFELQRGLEVIEHHGLPDGECEALLALLRFE